jgi:hypothetical protein
VSSQNLVLSHCAETISSRIPEGSTSFQQQHDVIWEILWWRLCTAPRSGCQWTSGDAVNRVGQAYGCSSHKSTTGAISELGISQSRVWWIILKTLKRKHYRLCKKNSVSLFLFHKRSNVAHFRNSVTFLVSGAQFLSGVLGQLRNSQKLTQISVK